MVDIKIITDLSFGDAGKGTTIDYLSRQAASTVVIRYNGGPQAAHNVITPDGRHHTFAQFGSGSLVSGTATHLSADMLINPFNMLPEAEHLVSLGQGDIWERLTIDRQAKIITPWHIAVNRLRERARGDGRHGSCAQGVGEVMADDLSHPELTLRAGDVLSPTLPSRLEALRAFKLRQARVELPHGDDGDWAMLENTELIQEIAASYQSWGRLVRLVGSGYLALLAEQYDQILFEGAQGVLLDEWYGFHPFTTWSTTTPENALRQLERIGYDGPVETLGLVRAYTTRHGPGPFVTEDQSLADPLREYHNDTGEWQGAFRYGHFDAVAHRYAIEACKGVDQLVVTGVDRAADLPTWQMADAYRLGLPSDERYFVPSADGFVRDIALGTKGDLVYQEQLGNALFRARPHYSITSAKAPTDYIVRSIEDALRVPVGIVSYGSSAAHKQQLIHA